MSDTFEENIIRIQQDHNISEREAVRVALSMERLVQQRATKDAA